MARFNKRVFFSFLFIFLGYFVFRLRTHTYVFSSTVSNTPPVEIWEYVSDFNNMKHLLPNLISFNIETESGHYENWKYRVYYEEYLSNLYFFTNFAWAEYETKILSVNKYAVYSSHQTCFGCSLFCLHTNATFEVEGATDSPDSTYTETIQYECPAVLKLFCEEEIIIQRQRMKQAIEAEFKERERKRV